MAHEFYSTKDGKYVYAQSWGSGHLVKIATSNDKVVKAFSKQECRMAHAPWKRCTRFAQVIKKGLGLSISGWMADSSKC
jgi:hypothetical protein